MSRKALLNQAVSQFATNLQYCIPKRYRTKDNFEYLVYSEKIYFKGSIHFSSYFDYKDFGYFHGSHARLSTATNLTIGNIVFYKDMRYVISEQIAFNETMGIYHFTLENLQEYYDCLIVNELPQEFENLNTNSSFFILSLDYNIPIIPARFMPQEPNTKKYISFEVQGTKALSIPYQDNNLLKQVKQDTIIFYAINLNAKELQDFLYFITHQNTFGYAGMPCFKISENTFIENINVRANIQECNIIINYNIATPFNDTEPLIEKVAININQILEEQS